MIKLYVEVIGAAVGDSAMNVYRDAVIIKPVDYKYELKPGDNHFGIAIYGKINNEYEYVDFVYRTVAYQATGPRINSISLYNGYSAYEIIGTGFGATQLTSTVTFNGIISPYISSWSDTRIVANVPSGNLTGNVVVTVNGVASNSFPFGCTRYVDNGDGTITDNTTFLVWQKSENSSEYTWYLATGTYERNQNPLSENVCGDGWRLPTIDELDGLDFNYLNGCMASTFFPDAKTNKDFYWSSTSDAGNQDKAWNILWNMERKFTDYKASHYHVKCVRYGGL